MYLSRLILNPQHRQVQRELANPYERHRTIMRAFPSDLPEDERVLHRLEVNPHTGAVALLVQSIHPPDWQFLADKPGFLLTRSAFKMFAPRVHRGQVLRFRLHANPTVKLKREGHKNSNRVPLKDEAQQVDWLQRKAEQHGFRIPSARQNLPATRVTRLGDQRGRVRHDDASYTVQIFVVQFDGLLQVVDGERFLKAIRDGIGPAKAFGCGLLSIAPAQ